MAYVSELVGPSREPVPVPFMLRLVLDSGWRYSLCSARCVQLRSSAAQASALITKQLCRCETERRERGNVMRSVDPRQHPYRERPERSPNPVLLIGQRGLSL